MRENTPWGDLAHALGLSRAPAILSLGVPNLTRNIGTQVKKAKKNSGYVTTHFFYLINTF